ncbi:tRNA pseudouridine(38-40) synthase TruA [Alloacidobacterium dinghuense]|uniref:tRNA pseudouridine synthase A n=1 Tax=Alloacidobacterium dinghuense TaxID=2763107 RepID=A0A7G8BN98_9BACT|nr:tRNA pseudouridine(38-40) synthase TruA [Alloacidobacterium dinghuense]QNI34018.1 tRNA pseudouridine(38-40) synthase TruA [Alloacidobacterium dinghuense]
MVEKIRERGEPGVSGWKLVLAYDGTDFHGWQVQPDQVTIQGTLADAIERITGERVLPQGSGRTDAGVHALGQVASFAMAAAIPAANFHRALNRALPASIRVLEAASVAPDFHARHSAVGKRYEYRIFRGEICPPWISRYVYALNWPLDLDAMREAAAVVVGEHDFASFAASDPDLARRSAPNTISDSISDQGEGASTVRTIFSSRWDCVDSDLLVYRVHGSAFLHHMVRNLVGTFLDVGRGHIAATEMKRILEARSRTAAGATAPARGLWLISVEY